jgi:hypothetical protein
VLTRRAVGAVLGLGLGAVAAGGATGSARSAPPACGPAPAGTSQSFAYSGKPQAFAVPAGVTRLTVAVEGGHGGQYSGSSHGGAAGGVDATLAVRPAECLTVYVGGFGGKAGGFGWGEGGAGGKISGDGSGNSAAGGGGASAVVRGADALVVAGGGGGGGGDGASQYGGGGGDGGAKPGRGHDAAAPYGGAGGRGGGASGRDGERGDGNTEQAVGAGGGGGGGWNGGGPGLKGRRASGGGGGGGGRSHVADAGGVSATTYFTSTRSCPYRKTPSTCHGAVTLSWAPPGSGEQPLLPLTPLVRVLSLDIDAAASRGIPVSVTAASSSVRLELMHRGARVAGRTVPARTSGPTRLRLRAVADTRRWLSRARFAAMKLRVIRRDEVTSQRLALH